MARVNIYVPDDLAESARSSNLNVSQLAQEAIRRALSARDVDAWLDKLAVLKYTGIDQQIVSNAVTAAKDEFEFGS